MTSSTGWRETARISANSNFVPRPWPLSKIDRRTLTPFANARERQEGGLVLPRSLANRRAHHELKDLILAAARCQGCRDVLLGDPFGVPGHLLDQRVHRLFELCVVEGGTTLGMRCRPFSLEYSLDQSLPRLSDVGHRYVLCPLMRAGPFAGKPTYPSTRDRKQFSINWQHRLRAVSRFSGSADECSLKQVGNPR